MKITTEKETTPFRHHLNKFNCFSSRKIPSIILAISSVATAIIRLPHNSTLLGYWNIFNLHFLSIRLR